LNRGYSIAIGIVLGALAAIVGSRVRDLDPAADARRADLERRVRALEVGSATKGGSRPVVPPEVQAKLHRELHAARIARHDRETVDAEWSATMTKLVTAQLDHDAAELQFKVTRVECRNVSCVVGLEWSSRNAALAAEGSLVPLLAGMPCTREVLFDEPTDPAAKIGASMVLECERSSATK
jgi:hypothetical protein